MNSHHLKINALPLALAEDFFNPFRGLGCFLVIGFSEKGHAMACPYGFREQIIRSIRNVNSPPDFL